MIVMHLVDLGAQVHYRNVNKETVLMKACAKGNREIMDYLLSHFTTGIEILASLTAQVTPPRTPFTHSNTHIQSNMYS